MSFPKDQLALLMPYTKNIDKTATTFFKAKDLKATADLRTLIQTYNVPLVGRTHNGGKAALQALVCQVLNDFTCLHNTQGRARHDWDISASDLLSMPYGTVYVALHGWSDAKRQEWPEFSPSIKAELSGTFSTWHWSGNIIDLPATPVVPLRMLYSPLEVTTSQVVDVRCWLTGIDLPSAKELARGYALICLGSKILLAPMKDLLEGGKEGPILSVATDTQEARQARLKRCIQVTCFFSERPQCKRWMRKYTLEGETEVEIIRKVKNALISLDDGLTVIWGEEFDRRVQVPKSTPVLSDDVGGKQTKASSQPQKQYLCSACDRSFNDNASKRLHIIAKHQEVYQQWVHQCEFCGGRWEQKRGLSVHKTKCPNKKK